MNGQPDEALELIHRHADSEETRALHQHCDHHRAKGFAMASRFLTYRCGVPSVRLLSTVNKYVETLV